MLFTIKSDLPAEYRKNVKIYIHDQIVTTSFWAIDPEDEKNALLQLDHKIIKNMRFNSYGMEIKYSDKSKFANEVKRGYFAVIESAKEIIFEEIEVLKKDLAFHEFLPCMRSVKKAMPSDFSEKFIYKLKSDVSAKEFARILEIYRKCGENN